jgi:RNA polymerase sigma-70 factor (ECF subfamily)
MKYRLTGKLEARDDKSLVNHYRESGDIDVLGVLYKRYMVLVYGVCLKYLKDRERAKDAVMDIFEKLTVELQVKEVDNFRPWLYVVAKNHCLMALRSMKVDTRNEEKYQNELSFFMESESFVHPVDEPDADLNGALKDCIERLKVEQKQCVELFYFENKCYKEIAGELNLEIKKVKSFIQNGKRNLKNCLENSNG